MADQFNADEAVASYIADSTGTPGPKPTMQDAMSQAVTVNPDTQAELARISQRTGVPVDSLAANPDEAKRQGAMSQIDFDTYTAMNPTAARNLSDPAFAKVAHDDTDNLAGIEQSLAKSKAIMDKVQVDLNTLQGTSTAQKYLGASLKSGLIELPGALARVVDAINPWTISESDLAVLYKDDPEGLAKAQKGPAMFLDNFAKRQTELAQNVIKNMPDDARRQYEQLQYATLDPEKAAYLSPVKVVGDALQSAPSTLALMATVYLTRGAAAKAESEALLAGASPELAKKMAMKAASETAKKYGAISEGAIGYGQQYDQARQQADEQMGPLYNPAYKKLIDEGFDDATARAYLSAVAAQESGLTGGYVDAITNLVGGHFLGKLIGEGGSLGKRVAKGFVTEGATETVQSGGEQLGSNIATQQNIDPSQSTWQGVAESMVQGLVVGGATGGTFAGALGRAPHRAETLAEKAYAAETGAQHIEDVVQLAQDSKLRSRDPVAFANFVQQAAEAGGVETMYLDPRALAQSGVNIEELAQASPSVAAQLRDSIATGADIQIPTSEFATHLAGTDMGTALVDHLRTDPDGFSRAEAHAYMQTQAPQLEADINRVVEQTAADNAIRQSQNEVEKNILGQLANTARFTSTVNKAYASLLSNFFAVQAARIGVTPEELYKQYKLKIQAERIDGGKGFFSAVAERLRGKPSLVGPDGNVELTHYSSTPGLTIADPAQWGKTGAALTRAERNRVGSAPGRTYFGANDYVKEPQLGNVKYTASVPAADLYDSVKDPLNLRQKAADQVNSGLAYDPTSAFEKLVTENGYKGAIFPTAKNGTAVAMYAPLPITMVDEKGIMAPLTGAPKAQQAPSAVARHAAYDYMESKGLNYAPPKAYAKLDTDRARRIATAFENMEHNPQDPEVKAAYAAMIDETLEQYQQIKKTGLKIEMIAPGQANPYEATPRMAIDDVNENNHLWVFPTDQGFGTQTEIKDNPLLAPVDEYIDGKQLVANDVFRIVHDYFGHIKDGTGFRAEGEENAWQSHAAMYSPLARRAMTTETRGQNSWLNYGPHGEHNRTAKEADTIFADQKIGLLPEWVSEEGFLGEAYSGTPIDAPGYAQPARMTETEGFKRWFKESKVVDANGEPLRVYHGTVNSFDVFDSSKSGDATGASDTKDAFFFSASAEVASSYAYEPQPKNTFLNRVNEKLMRTLGFGVERGGENVMPVYLNIKNPLDIDGEGREYSERYFKQYVDAARVRGHDGLIVRNIIDHGFSEGETAPSAVYVVFEPTQVKSATGNSGEFSRRDPNILRQDEVETKGFFDPNTRTLSLLKSADLSTFLHESGHYFLEIMTDLANRENAPQDIKDDLQTFFSWANISDLTHWNSLDIEGRRQAHEQFARGFEAYLFDGKAPSVELQGLFQKFRAWLLRVYRSINNLNVELSPDIRGVFDRMLATADQIQEAENFRQMENLYGSMAESGMTSAEYIEYQKQGLQATQDAVAALEARSLRDMKWLSGARGRELKKLQKEAAVRRAEIKREVTKEVMAEPVNQATQFLRRGLLNGEQVTEGGTKLSIPEIEAMYGDNPIVGAIKTKLGVGKYGMLGRENAIHPDQVAEMFGFTSGDELVRTLLSNEDPQEKINGITDQRMLERYGDLTDPDSMQRAADKAVHNEARAKFISAELDALNKARGDAAARRTSREAAAAFARTAIGRLKVMDLKPTRFAAAEARAALAAAKAFKKGDIELAAAEKRNQLINNYSAKEAYAAQEEVEKTLRYLKKFENAGSRKKIDTAYLDQIDAILERFDLRSGTTLKDLKKRASLAEWVKSQNEQGLDPDIDPKILNEANRQSYKEMTVDELRGLRDTIEQIDHLGRLKDKLLTAKDNKAFKATVSTIVDNINANAKGRTADNRTRAGIGEGVRLFKGFMASHRKVASLVKELDGFHDGGPLWNTFIRTMNEAGDKEAGMREKATKKLAKLIAPILSGEPMGGKGKFFESIGTSLNREERLGIALNMGNAGNIQRLLDGEGWNRAQIQPVLDTLTKEDWDFVQNVWDMFESYRPDIGALEKKIYGKEPNWVEPQAIQTKYGEYRGGYYPVKYDPARSIQAEQFDQAQVAKQIMESAFTSSTTRRSFTKARADEVKGRPLLYSMDGLYQGLNEVIHDLSWREWGIDATRLMRSRSLDGAIRNQYGAQVKAQITSAMTDILAGENARDGAFGATLNKVRTGAMVAGIGFNILNSIINVTGITQSFARIGTKYMAIGLGEYTRNPRDLTSRVQAKSEFMRLRAQTMNRELNEIRSLVRGTSKPREVLDRLMFYPMTLTQIAVDTPTWWGAYQKAMAEQDDEAKGVAMADQAVLDAQGGGQVKDLSEIQRGGPLKKLFTTFYGYFNSGYNLLAEATNKTDFKDPKDVLRLAGDYMMLTVVPAFLGTLLKTALTGGEDDWDAEKLAKNLANDQISYLFGMMVGVRETTAMVQKVFGVNTYSSAYGGPAGLRFYQELDKLATQLSQGEVDEALVKSVINVTGILFHLPSSQINRTIFGTEALINGDTSNPLAVVNGPPPKK